MKLVELQAKCMQLGLDPIPTKKRRNPDRFELSVADCTKAIRNYYISKYKDEGTYSKSLDYVLSIDTPMLASLITQQDSLVQNEIWNDYNTTWQFQRKYNGIRFLMIWSSEDKKLALYSRSVSDETLLPINYSDYFNFDISNLKDDFILDLEMVYSNFEDYGIKDIKVAFEDIVEEKGMFTNDKFKFVLLDTLFSDSKWITGLTLSNRQYVSNELLNGLKMAEIGYTIESVDIKPSYMSKEEYYYSIIDNNGEGVIAKDLNSPYEYKRANTWVKIKPRISDTTSANLRDTIDAFVSGFIVNDVTGLIDTLLFSIYSDDNIILVNRLFLSKSLQTKVTNYDESGNVILNPGYKNRVAEFSFDILTINYLMLHPKLLYWRLDKSKDSCVYSKDYLDTFI